MKPRTNRVPFVSRTSAARDNFIGKNDCLYVIFTFRAGTTARQRKDMLCKLLKIGTILDRVDGDCLNTIRVSVSIGTNTETMLRERLHAIGVHHGIYYGNGTVNPLSTGSGTDKRTSVAKEREQVYRKHAQVLDKQLHSYWNAILGDDAHVRAYYAHLRSQGRTALARIARDCRAEIVSRFHSIARLVIDGFNEGKLSDTEANKRLASIKAAMARALNGVRLDKTSYRGVAEEMGRVTKHDAMKDFRYDDTTPYAAGVAYVEDDFFAGV